MKSLNFSFSFLISFAFLILLSFVNISNSISQITFNLKKKSTQCFYEELKVDEFFRFEVKTDIYSVKIDYTLPGDIKQVFPGSNDFKRSLHSKKAGEFQFCITSTSYNDQKIFLKFATGLAAKDFSELVKEEDLKPINTKVSKKNYY